MPVTDHEKLPLPTWPSPDFLAAIPLKKRHFLFTRSPSPPQESPSPVVANGGISENKNESSELEPSHKKPRSNSGGKHTIEDFGTCEKKQKSLVVSTPQDKLALVNNVAPCESSVLTDSLKHEKKQGISELAYNSSDFGIADKKPENSVRASLSQMNSDIGEHASIESSKESVVIESRDLNLVPKLGAVPSIDEQGSNKLSVKSEDRNCHVQETDPINYGSGIVSSARNQPFELPDKFRLDSGISVKQEGLSDTKLKDDSSHIYPNRSNWDLNTPFDVWEGSSANSVLNNGITENKDLGVVHNRNLELGFKQILCKGSNGTDGNNHHLKLQNHFDSNSEACLDLQLKPLSHSCNSLGKLNSISEMSFLTLGTKPVPSTTEPQLSIGTWVKSEPIVRDQMQKKTSGKVQMGTMKSIDLNKVKSEPIEVQEISKTAISNNVNLVCSNVTIKSEALDQIKPMEQIACKDDETSNVAPKPSVLNGVAHSCTDSPIINISNNSSGTIDSARLLVNQTPVATELTYLMSNSLISDKNVTDATSKACEISSLTLAENPENLASNSNTQHSSNSTLTDDVLKKTRGNSKVAESDEVEGEVGIEELCDATCRSDSSHANTTYEKSGMDNEDNHTAEASCEVTKEQQVRTLDSISPTNNTMTDVNIHYDNTVETSSSLAGKMRKNVSRTLKDNSKDGKGLEKNLKSNTISLKITSSDNQIEEQNNRRKTVSEKETVSKDSNNNKGNQRRIIYLNAALGKRDSTSDQPLFSRDAKRAVGKTFRSESFNEKPRRVDNENRYGHQTGNSRSDFPRTKRRAEQVNNSKFSNRQSRKQLLNDEKQNLSHLPFQVQRRSPLSHHHSIRDINPNNNKFTRREVQDFSQLAHEETQYDRIRERRSFSPPLRRSGPLHLPPSRPISQWSPPRRSSNEFSGVCELIRRSPQLVRLPCYPQERIGGRRMDAGPSREDDYSRPDRGSNKNMRRFHTMMDPREINEDDGEGYFGQIQGFDVDDEFTDDGRCNERRGGPIRENFRFHDEVGTNPRDFDARFRNRLGNSNGRFRGIVDDQEDNYRVREEQEWRDSSTSFSDARIKRRRF